MAVAAAGYLPTAPTPPQGTRPDPAGDRRHDGTLTVIGRIRPRRLEKGSASSAFIGGFENCAFGIRQAVTIESSRVSGTAFEKNQILVRAILRADFLAIRPTQLGRLVGIL